MELYAAIDLGARRLDMINAIRFCSGDNGGGSRMISGSANRLYKNPNNNHNDNNNNNKWFIVLFKK